MTKNVAQYPSFYKIFSFVELPDIYVVDVGASAIDGNPPYYNIKKIDRAIIYGFEPSPKEYKRLLEIAKPKEIYLPYAIGDGSEGVLNICQAPGMTSLLNPDLNILNYFYGFPEWGKVIEKEAMKTYPLDDIEEIEQVDYIKLDVQGGELNIAIIMVMEYKMIPLNPP